MTLQQLAPRLTQPAVRALAWLIGSPGLLDAGDARFGPQLLPDAWYEEALRQAAPWLLGLDQEPQPLLEFLAAQPTRRLGRFAENLLAFWLRQRPGVDLLARNLPVRADKQTLGEFDFVFREAGIVPAMHWELAVKFYLYRPEIGGLAGYVGPNEKDTLGAKTQRVFDHQLKLSSTPAGRAAMLGVGAQTVQERALIKGWLFYPRAADVVPVTGVNPLHARGWWMRATPGWESALEQGPRYAILPRAEWLGWPWALASDATLDRTALAAAVSGRICDGALMVVELVSEEGLWHERTRGFVVPPGWGTTAPAA